MGLEKATDILFEKKGAAPGKAVIIQTIGAGEQERNAEMYHNPGISSAPTKEDRVISIPVGTGTKVIIASHNYRIEVEPEAGETIIYSTNSKGDTVKSKIKLDNDGNIDLNGDTKKLVTHAELNTALQSFVVALNAELATISAGAAAAISASGLWLTPLTIGANSIDISSAETTTIRTDG